MPISDISTTAIAMQQSLLATNIQVAMLNKTTETESQGVQMLLEAATAPTSNAPHLGNLVDTSA